MDNYQLKPLSSLNRKNESTIRLKINFFRFNAVVDVIYRTFCVVFACKWLH